MVQVCTEMIMVNQVRVLAEGPYWSVVGGVVLRPQYAVGGYKFITHCNMTAVPSVARQRRPGARTSAMLI